MKAIGFGNTRILTGCAQKSLQTLLMNIGFMSFFHLVSCQLRVVLHTRPRAMKTYNDLTFLVVMVGGPKIMVKRNPHHFLKALFTGHSMKWS